MRALFIDRDGIFNEIVYRDGNMHSPRNWSEITHFDLNGLKDVKKLGFLLILITNQPDIERGIVPQSFVDELHSYYQKLYALDAIYTCPYASNSHPLKKPNPGMFLTAAKDHHLALAESYHLGDTANDSIGAKNAGIKSILWDRTYNQNVKSDFRISCLAELLKILRENPNELS